MLFKQKNHEKENGAGRNVLNDNGTLKVILFASLIIVLSVSLMGLISYVITKNAVVSKLKSKDLIYIAQSISSKINGRIERAKETSLILARDPYILKWIIDGEKDDALGKLALDKITDISNNYDYNNSFIVSAVTNHYWAEGGKLIDTMSITDPDDNWFFDIINSKKPVSIVIDYNKERGDTFVFVDALMGDINKPAAVTGVGLNLKDISKEIEGYKFGEKSNMWLIDNKGFIYISEDVDQVEKNIGNFIPKDISKEIIANAQISNNGNLKILEYKNSNGEIYDLVYQPIKYTDWKLIFQIPRSESTYIIDSIKINTVTASLVTIILIVLIFYLVSNRISNPYKRAVLLSLELEKKVNERTQEINEKNIKIMDSIEYAKMIQESILPGEEELEKVCKDYFIIWKPRDIVGGDFYWIKIFDSNKYIMAVGDCTGHGVPGALMTMAVNSILDRIVDEICSSNPALILKELNGLVRQTLHKKNERDNMDDGLGIGIVYVEGNNMTFAGARASLYMKDTNGLTLIKGDNKGIGYKRTSNDYEFKNHNIYFDDTSVLYITTDGYLDQNGGEKDYSFGRRRFEKIINDVYSQPLSRQKEIFGEELGNYMRDRMQRDDITVICFKPKL